jgi:hypothetical protein
MICQDVLTLNDLRKQTGNKDIYGNPYGSFQFFIDDKNLSLFTINYYAQGASASLKYLEQALSYMEPPQPIPNQQIGVGIISAKMIRVPFETYDSPSRLYLINSKKSDLWMLALGYKIADGISSPLLLQRSCLKNTLSLLQIDCGTFDKYGNGYGSFSVRADELNATIDIEYKSNQIRYYLQDTILRDRNCSQTISIPSTEIDIASGLLMFRVNDSACPLAANSLLKIKFKDNYRSSRRDYWTVESKLNDGQFFRAPCSKTCLVPRYPM